MGGKKKKKRFRTDHSQTIEQLSWCVCDLQMPYLKLNIIWKNYWKNVF